jgi:hypothetical protein
MRLHDYCSAMRLHDYFTKVRLGGMRFQTTAPINLQMWLMLILHLSFLLKYCLSYKVK